jgi:hypothetical protein
VPDPATRATPAPSASRPAAGALGRALQTVVRKVTVAAGVFAPGHLGELTRHVPFELVDAVLDETGTRQRRLRDLPSARAACCARPTPKACDRRCGRC